MSHQPRALGVWLGVTAHSPFQALGRVMQTPLGLLGEVTPRCGSPRSGRLPQVRAAPPGQGGSGSSWWRSWWRLPALCPASSCDAALDPAPGKAVDLEVTTGTKGQDGSGRWAAWRRGPEVPQCLRRTPRAGDTAAQQPRGRQLVARRVGSASPAPAGGAPLLGVTSPRLPCRELRVHPDLSPC